ncbi:ATP-binding protein [Streptomyces sp. SM11]|uniref:ATP-binding protein n=1 Tax=Streptomyces sp. SM11 TaxID=565557 RepID=UPI0021562CD6|nr:ATP-binding protein [Streptomyces sp. SM11]
MPESVPIVSAPVSVTASAHMSAITSAPVSDPVPTSVADADPVVRSGRERAGGGPRSGFPAYVLGSPFALRAPAGVTQCPPPPPDLGEPSAARFVYGLTLPSATATPLIAHEAADAVLDVHGVEDELIEPALELVHELAVHACRFTGAGEMVHLVLRRADGVLQVVVHDTHAPHFAPRLAGQCAERRKVSLAVVRELSERHQGEWGFAAAQPPAAGVCTWATLVRVPPAPPATPVPPVFDAASGAAPGRAA